MKKFWKWMHDKYKWSQWNETDFLRALGQSEGRVRLMGYMIEYLSDNGFYVHIFLYETIESYYSRLKDAIKKIK